MQNRTADLRTWPALVIMTVLLAVSLGGCKGGQENDEILREAQTEEAKDSSKGEEKEQSVREEQAGKEDPEGVLYVHVCGQVKYPGVYELPPGSRVFQAIDAAKGLTDEAAPECLNEAAKVSDGQQVYVPAKGEARQDAGQAVDAAVSAEIKPDDGKININTAAADELMQLNGIGKARASSIIKFREEHGSFQSIEELKEVEGIKEGIFTKIKDQIKI